MSSNISLFYFCNRELKYVIQRFAEDPRQEVRQETAVCRKGVVRLTVSAECLLNIGTVDLVNNALLSFSHCECICMCFSHRSTPVCSACALEKTGGSSSTVQEA